jgi:hypothetical protein
MKRPNDSGNNHKFDVTVLVLVMSLIIFLVGVIVQREFVAILAMVANWVSFILGYYFCKEAYKGK